VSDLTAHVVIVGAGHAGGSAAAFLRQYGWKGPITLIGSEPELPYQRPPLSKAWLCGDLDFASLLLRHSEFYPTNSIECRRNETVVGIDRSARQISLPNRDAITYGHLILALGSTARALPVPGHDLRGVVQLRTLADANRLKALLVPGARLAIIGAGYIGLEVAASARALGVDVTVIEREPRVLPRVASEPLSAFFTRRHTEAGVHIILNASVEALEGDGRSVRAVCLQHGASVPCDAVLAGIGAVPNDTLARASGIECKNGITVDLSARTNDPLIHAIGDCTHRPLPLYARVARLESVPNALEQAKQAAADLCGRAPPIPEVPWFWSDQYEVRLQIAGVSFDVVDHVIRGDPNTGSFSIYHLSAEGTVQAVEAVNAPADFMAGRVMIARRKRPPSAALRDVSYSLRELTG
jgi:3-phenylpropionate/trans-cinnamate dioxygenase ferredoxin reductase component